MRRFILALAVFAAGFTVGWIAYVAKISSLGSTTDVNPADINTHLEVLSKDSTTSTASCPPCPLSCSPPKGGDIALPSGTSVHNGMLVISRSPRLRMWSGKPTVGLAYVGNGSGATRRRVHPMDDEIGMELIHKMRSEAQVRAKRGERLAQTLGRASFARMPVAFVPQESRLDEEREDLSDPLPNRVASGFFIQPRPNLWLSLDDVLFSYDLFYEHTKLFAFTSWLGIKCQQDPHGAWAIQEMIYRVKPDLIVEFGTNTGGGAIFYSTIMRTYNPRGIVVTIDVRPTRNDWLEMSSKWCPRCGVGDDHPFWNDGGIVSIVGDVLKNQSMVMDIETKFVRKSTTVLVIEDADHVRDGTARRAIIGAKWVSRGSYLLIQDTKLDRITGRYEWPMGAVNDFLATVEGQHFRIDRHFERLGYSQHHRGYLRKI